ncbi:hypothetical protein GCM10023217_34530 [Gordonia alkaliphila]|uniref:Protein-tyrosine-phosphatase-like N-terminal domain-containing protein n=1 Tax=Gordonia alkaliphila TaxID=1053547 RepID=A0ABP8ZKN7_9ACTN
MNADATTESAGTPDLLMPQALLSRTAERLAAHYRGIVSEQTVERVVFESYTALRRTSRIHTHLVTLTGRFAAECQAPGFLETDLVGFLGCQSRVGLDV